MKISSVKALDWIHAEIIKVENAMSTLSVLEQRVGEEYPKLNYLLMGARAGLGIAATTIVDLEEVTQEEEKE